MVCCRISGCCWYDPLELLSIPGECSVGAVEKCFSLFIIGEVGAVEKCPSLFTIGDCGDAKELIELFTSVAPTRSISLAGCGTGLISSAMANKQDLVLVRVKVLLKTSKRDEKLEMKIT
jgi:hypothetical protein